MPTIAVSPSSLGTYRACPKKFEFASLRRLRPAGLTPLITRELGSWWHALRAADAIHRSRSQETPPLYLPETISTGDMGPELPVTQDTCGSDVLLAAQRFWDAMPFEQQERWVEKRSEEHTSELQSLMRISYAVFCLKKKNT